MGLSVPSTTVTCAEQTVAAPQPKHIYVLSEASPDAGRSHVIAAMARALGKRTGAQVHEYYHLDRHSLGKTSDWDAFWKDKAQPDVVFEDGMYFYTKPVNGKDVFFVRRDREEEWMKNPPSHFIFADCDAEVAQFEHSFADIKRPLIAVCLAAPDASFIKETLVNIAKRYEKGTIFVTSSPRTNPEEFQRGLKQAEIKLSAMGRPDLKLMRHIYKDEDGRYNPHTGLLNDADAIVIVGESRSMLADAQATSATVYTTGWETPSAPMLDAGQDKLKMEPRVRMDGTAIIVKQLLADYERWTKEGPPVITSIFAR